MRTTHATDPAFAAIALLDLVARPAHSTRYTSVAVPQHLVLPLELAVASS